MNKAKDYLVTCGIDDRYHLQQKTEKGEKIVGGASGYTSDLMELWAEKESTGIRDMLIKTHTALGIKLYFQINNITWYEWKTLPPEIKEKYCEMASKEAGIDHKRYLEILKGK